MSDHGAFFVLDFEFIFEYELTIKHVLLEVFV